MEDPRRPRVPWPRPATLIATLALGVALGGGAVAAGDLITGADVTGTILAFPVTVP